MKSKSDECNLRSYTIKSVFSASKTLPSEFWCKLIFLKSSQVRDDHYSLIMRCLQENYSFLEFVPYSKEIRFTKQFSTEIPNKCTLNQAQSYSPVDWLVWLRIEMEKIASYMEKIILYKCQALESQNVCKWFGMYNLLK